MKSTLIKTLQVDQGGEFINYELKQYLENLGCHLRTSLTGESQQNGVAERAHRTIQEGTRCLLLESDLPQIYWEDAAEYYVYILNRTMCKSTIPKDQTPYEALFGEKPDLGDVQPFGVPCFYHIPKKQDKLAPTAREGRFLGFGKHNKGYKILDVQSRSIIYSRSVKFSPIHSRRQPLDLHYENEELLTDEDLMEEEDVEEYLPVEHRVLQHLQEKQPKYLGTQLTRFCMDVGSECFASEELTPDMIIENIQSKQLMEAIESPPRNLTEAMGEIDRKVWWNASVKEFEALVNNGTWEEVKVPKNTPTIGTRWIYVIKYDENGLPTKHKARLVAQGFTQKEGVNFNEHEVYAPVASYATIRLLIAIATELKMDIQQMDVDSAYLNSNLSNTVYLRLPKGYDRLNHKCMDYATSTNEYNSNEKSVKT